MAAKKPQQNKQREPQRSRTPETKIPPPSTHREDLLPLVAVGSKKFEDLCRSVLKPEFEEIRRVALKRTSGVEQYGVDVEGFDENHDPVVVLSAKCYKTIEAWEFRPWIQDFIDHLDNHWKDSNVKHFILAVTVTANDDDMNKAARGLAKSLGERGIKFHLWDAGHITDLLSSNPQLVDRYFNRHWVEAISAEIASDSPSVNPTAAVSLNNAGGALALLAAQFQEVYVGPLNSAVSRELDAALAALRRGKRDPIRSWVEANRANVAAWGAIEPAVRAKGLRVLAVIELAEEKGTVAEALLSEADALIEEEDPTARVMFRRVTDGVRAALKELGTPSTRRERELAAGLLIDDDDPRTALDVLSPLAGEDVSSEVMRLRAIATLLVGKGAAAALRLADSALAKEPEGAIARLTRGIIQIAAALVDGVQPGFGGPPTPISRALVRSERTAYEHLEAAQREFEELLAVVDGDLRLELEVWKLAALILNPGKRQEARAYSRYLLSKPVPDPSAVAWCLQHGLPMKRGRIKKTIGDLLRNQRGTPGHVVVLALLAAKMDRPSLAIAVFKKFESQFPEASVFFESWREQFGENAGPPEASYAAAIRYGIETKSYAPLVAFLSSGLSTTEAIIAGSEFLMARKAYTEVLSLRAGLSSIGTARSVEIAAVAAFRLEDFNGSIEILADASRAGLSLPPRLVQLRLRAQEASGDHFNLIKDLKALLRESDDPDLRGRLFDAYVRIGALEDAAQVTKEAIAAGSLDNVNALRAANVLRNFAPETARRAIADIKPDELPKELLPTLLGLSAELGLREVQDEMVRRLFADPSPDGAVTRFDSVEAVIEFMNDRADKYRATIEQWLAGAQPAALTFSGDSKDYALLFLGDRRTRRANMGYSFPMMLTAGTYRSADTLETVGRPGLRMELGALLLADRFRLLDKIEQVFEIYVPPSLPEALVEIRGHFRNVSDAVASHFRAIGRRDSAVQVVTKPGDGARKIQFLHHAPDGDDSRAVFLSVLEHAFQGGHVTKAEKQSARAALGVSDDPLPELTFDSVVISSQALFDLVGLGILEAIARSFSVAVLDTELEQHLKQIDLVEAEGRIGIKVEELRKTVSDRLGSSAWHTLPSRDADFQSMRMQPPAHVRCLIETLPREEAEAPTLFWFEDRTLSRNPPSGAVNLGQMLATLRKSEQLTDDEYFEAMKKLRDAGYSFLPIDADELFAQIRSAPIVSDRVVENDDLSSIRSWFAQDAINLKYIDLTVEIDPSGRVLGESRRTLQLTHLVQDLFALVWSDESATSIEKAARSLWIWTNLRLDCTPSPLGPENPQIRRQFAALNVAQTLALPLHAELGTPEIPKTARQEMVDWLVSVAIEPLAEADPAALELVWDTLAGMLTRLLEPTKERDERIRQALDAHMQRIVAGYLRLLPLEWADQIVSRGSVESVLTRQTVMLLEVGNDQVAVESIAKAFSDAVFSQTNSARFKYYKSGKSALLTLEPDERGIPTGTIKKGRQSGSIDAVTIATLHPDPVIREQIFLSAAEIGSVGRPISQEERVSLAREPDAERRVEILHEFYAADFSRSLSQLDIRIQRKGQLNIDDFDLPDPDVLLNYLGLARDFAGGGIELSANAFKAIKEKMSAREAVWRVSSLPVRVPEEVLPDFAAAVEIPQPGAHRYFMLDMAGAFARARTSGLPEEDLAFLGQVTDERLKFFRKVLIHGARQALRSDKWSEVDPDLVTYLLWLYADQLVRVLNPSEGSLAQLSAWLSTRSRRRLLDDEEIWGRWTKRCLFNLFPNRLKGAFVAELIELGVAIPPDLVSMVGKPVGSGDWLPNPELFATAPPNAPKECWISADPIPGFARVGWIEETHLFVARDPSRLLRNIMGEVQVENWRVLLPLVALIIDLDDIDADTISALRERVEAYLGLDDAFDPDPARSALLDVLADIYGQQRDREAFNGLLTNVIRLVKSKWPRDVADLHGDAESDRFAIELANATYVFCWAWHSDHSSRVNLFGEILKQAAEAWPGFGPFAIALLENIVVQVDMPTAAAAIWPVLFELRANR